MHPAMDAYMSNLSYNGVLVDIYIRHTGSLGFNTSTGQTTSSKTKYSSIQAVEAPIKNTYGHSRSVSSTRQKYETSIIFPISDIPEVPKLNDFAFMRNQRYEIVDVQTIAGSLYMLGLNNWKGDNREITWTINIKDTLSYSDQLVQH